MKCKILPASLSVWKWAGKLFTWPLICGRKYKLVLVVGQMLPHLDVHLFHQTLESTYGSDHTYNGGCEQLTYSV